MNVSYLAANCWCDLMFDLLTSESLSTLLHDEMNET